MNIFRGLGAKQPWRIYRGSVEGDQKSAKGKVIDCNLNMLAADMLSIDLQAWPRKRKAIRVTHLSRPSWSNQAVAPSHG